MTKTGIKCSFCNSDDRVVFSNGYDDYLCHKHYMQFYHTGVLKENFKNSKNPFFIFDNWIEIVLLNRMGEEVGRCIIDNEDFEKVKDYKIYLHKEGYATCSEGFIHNLLLDNKDEKIIVDHISRNKLDNRKENLRLATYSQNNMNSGIRSNSTTKVTGVSFAKLKGKWEAYLRINKKRVFHGYFENFRDAVNARKEAEIKYFGEYRCENK